MYPAVPMLFDADGTDITTPAVSLSEHTTHVVSRSKSQSQSSLGKRAVSHRILKKNIQNCLGRIRNLS